MLLLLALRLSPISEEFWVTRSFSARRWKVAWAWAFIGIFRAFIINEHMVIVRMKWDSNT